MSTPLPIPARTPGGDKNNVPIRHPLGLPRGSVRAILSLMIMAQFWILIAAPDRLVPMPLYLYCLMGLVFVFFASHGGTIAWAEDPEPSPLWLKGGVLRFFILAVTLGLFGWRLWSEWPEPVTLLDRLQPSPNAVGRLPFLLFSLVAGYGLGWVASRIFTALELSQYLQDIQASMSLVAIFLLLGALLGSVFVLPTLEHQVPALYLDYILVALVAWYFGVRT